METHNNSYSVKEDEVLWELHVIRHELHDELKTKPLEDINRGARAIFEDWKRIERPPVITPERDKGILIQIGYKKTSHYKIPE